MKHALKDILKEELHKLLVAGFIYPISNNEWVLPLVIVPKNNGKSRFLIYCKDLNKATNKDHFPLLFSTKFWMLLQERSYFHLWMGLASTIR